MFALVAGALAAVWTWKPTVDPLWTTPANWQVGGTTATEYPGQSTTDAEVVITYNTPETGCLLDANARSPLPIASISVSGPALPANGAPGLAVDGITLQVTNNVTLGAFSGADSMKLTADISAAYITVVPAATLMWERGTISAPVAVAGLLSATGNFARTLNAVATVSAGGVAMFDTQTTAQQLLTFGPSGSLRAVGGALLRFSGGLLMQLSAGARAAAAVEVDATSQLFVDATASLAVTLPGGGSVATNFLVAGTSRVAASAHLTLQGAGAQMGAVAIDGLLEVAGSGHTLGPVSGGGTVKLSPAAGGGVSSATVKGSSGTGVTVAGVAGDSLTYAASPSGDPPSVQTVVAQGASTLATASGVTLLATTSLTVSGSPLFQGSIRSPVVDASGGQEWGLDTGAVLTATTSLTLHGAHTNLRMGVSAWVNASAARASFSDMVTVTCDSQQVVQLGPTTLAPNATLTLSSCVTSFAAAPSLRAAPATGTAALGAGAKLTAQGGSLSAAVVSLARGATFAGSSATLQVGLVVPASGDAVAANFGASLPCGSPCGPIAGVTAGAFSFVDVAPPAPPPPGTAPAPVPVAGGCPECDSCPSKARCAWYLWMVLGVVVGGAVAVTAMWYSMRRRHEAEDEEGITRSLVHHTTAMPDPPPASA